MRALTAETVPQQIVSLYWRRVERRGDGECWGWRGIKDRDGYGRMWQGNRGPIFGAHRVAYALMVGPLTADDDVCHTCDVPECTNPRHLFRGDARANMLDCYRKGRLYVPTRSHSVHSKLTEGQVREIRARMADGGDKDALALEYGVSETAIRKIVKRQMWAHVA